MRDNIDFDEFKELLESHKTMTQERLNRELKLLKINSDSNSDLLDAASFSYIQQRSSGWIKYLQSRLSQIEEAILRLQTGSYGACFICGKEIEIERLRLKPYANYCVKCRKRIERK